MSNAVCDGRAGRRVWATSAMTMGLVRAALALCLIAPAASPALGQGVLEQIRDDVRTAPLVGAPSGHQRDDPAETNFGFNFTYGVDFFPVRPWVLSSTVDWGTLGRSGLFRFQATAGAVVHRVETYAGYEYLDLGSTQVNSLIGGVRIWF